MFKSSKDEKFYLLECAYCLNYFKIQYSDVIDYLDYSICCPCCGEKSPDYFRGVKLGLAQEVLKDQAASFVCSLINSLERVNFKCCKKEAKIMPTCKSGGCYCPFCGTVHLNIK